MFDKNGRKRVVITNVVPQVNGGRFPAKSVIGEELLIEADIFCDGHDKIAASILIKHETDRSWQEFRLHQHPNDHWTYTFVASKTGNYQFRIAAWIDHFESWKTTVLKRLDAQEDVSMDVAIGATLLNELSERVKGKDKKLITNYADQLKHANEPKRLMELLRDEELAQTVSSGSQKDFITVYPEILAIHVARKKAGFSAWYELFPRSAGADPGRHGTFKDVTTLLPFISEMGFDTLYLPPIHPIGLTYRKGKNNALSAEECDPGSPWAIGNQTGGHKSIHPELGSLKDFKRLITKAAGMGIEVAMDIAFQCSPDHPYIEEHPQWFKWRPDGSIQYAENPPKKYEDIVPFDFETADWQHLWKELKSIFQYWIAQGIHIFRVDNPHTKAFVFWEWVISEVQQEHPEVLFLSEAFTRPRVMERLAQLGFSQSYTYFTWRHTKQEIQTYIEELIHSETRYYLRPNFWPNTPDILTDDLAQGGENAHIIRLLLAATLSSNYGIYGPVYELGIAQQAPGKEEYADNEKYEIKNWDWQQKTRIRSVIQLINQIRKSFPALQTTWNTAFLETSNEQIIGYAKNDNQTNNHLLIFVNLDPHHTQSAHVHIPLAQLGISTIAPYRVEDLLSGDEYEWKEGWNFVQLNPHDMPAHILLIKSA